ncbi:hypothetical protein KUCAC02_009321 [Chaenocephalus aceratus]|uniref:Uncharacterized protein n=1 Tax=Chaenocephalus aceratus TaxID=36190 RepID=A0ACB9WT74_CHAAC|nr:hypothetical protein KUCAC02_009321 [Chaenocephalus aceratus]
MDVEGSSGRDSSWRRAAAAAAQDVGGRGSMEAQVVPLELYDSARAKIEANLRWLFAKAYGKDHIPADLRDPFYTDQYDQEHIKPPILRLLLSAELSCRVCALILPGGQAAALHTHLSVLQALSRRGVYVLEAGNSPVSDLDLSCSPIKMSSHIHLIDALMMAYMLEMISVEKVVSSVRRFSSGSASKELPFDLEDAMLFWINKVNVKMREILEKELKMKQHLMESPSHQKSPSKWYWKLVPPDMLHALASSLYEPVEFSQMVRYRRDHLSGRTLQHFPLLDDLLKDSELEDICLKEVPSIADSVYNIQLLQEFSNEYLNRCFYLKPEDVLYSPPVLKNNVMVFIAELFWWFESVKPDFVQPRDLHEFRDVRLLLQPKSSRSNIPISNVTKHSFLTTSNSADMLTTSPSPDLSTKPTSLSPSHCLLPLRQRQQKVADESSSVLRNRSNSLTPDGQNQGSILAWPDRRGRPLSVQAPYALHYPLEEDADSISLARSISKDSLASNILSTPKHMLGPQHRLSGQSLLSHMRIEDEEEDIEEAELAAVTHPSAFDMEQDELEIPSAASTSRVLNTRCSPFTPERPTDGYYLEPLMPTTPKPAKEKSISLNKEEESGESRFRAARKEASSIPQRKTPTPESNRGIFTAIQLAEAGRIRPPTEGSAVTPQPEKKLSPGFFLHMSGEPDPHCPLPSALGEGEVCKFRELECESAKLREDSKVSERDDKEGGSGRSSPCLSTASWASSASGSASVKMTSFAERKLLKLGLREEFSSTSSSQKTTPDGSEVTPCPPWQLRSDYTSSWLAKEPRSLLGKNLALSPSVVPSELLQLHMQLEEQRRAIEHQKKKMETLSARQRLKLGKAAFLNIVKKGGEKCDTLPLPLKQSSETADRGRMKPLLCKDDSCLDALKAREAQGGQMRKNRLNTLSQENVAEPDLNECSHSIDLLNDAISSIQQQMMQLSLQQNLLMKRVVSPADKPMKRAASPPEPLRKHASSPAEQEESSTSTTPITTPITTPTTTQSTPSASDPRSFAVHFVEISGSSSTPSRRPPKLSSSQRNKASEQKQMRENSKAASVRPITQPPGGREDSGRLQEKSVEEKPRPERSIRRNKTFRVGDDPEPRSSEEDNNCFFDCSSAFPSPELENKVTNSGKEAAEREEAAGVKGQLVEVDLSELKDRLEDVGADVTECTAEGEQKNTLGYFFKDEEKAEDELEKRRAAFLLKRQRKAEEARLRKQHQEVEYELKRDETRRKAEEDRIRKEEEKARREIIKQEYLQRKQQVLMEEQGLVKPRPRMKSRRSRPRSLHREEASSLSKGCATRHSLKTSLLIKAQSSAAGCRGADLSCSHRGSTLSLATEADSVISGGAESQRAGSVCSMESFPMLSRASSRNMERDWENGSIASSITSMEYNGPKLFKEPSSKSNKPIISNAIAHCCLAGKVNESQKNVILEELEKCESNHLIILFRDGGCQFRGIYSFSPETEEILKFTGTGPRSIGRKMIDKLYKYSSDRKQFNVIPAKSVSATVDALTIHNHLWQVKRPGSARRK